MSDVNSVLKCKISSYREKLDWVDLLVLMIVKLLYFYLLTNKHLICEFLYIVRMRTDECTRQLSLTYHDTIY